MITIFIRRYVADTTFIGDKIIESNQRTKNEYTETKSTMNVQDLSSVRQKFIEDTGRSIYNGNKLAESKAIRNKSKTIEKLIIYRVT